MEDGSAAAAASLFRDFSASDMLESAGPRRRRRRLLRGSGSDGGAGGAEGSRPVRRGSVGAVVGDDSLRLGLRLDRRYRGRHGRWDGRRNAVADGTGDRNVRLLALEGLEFDLVTQKGLYRHDFYAEVLMTLDLDQVVPLVVEHPRGHVHRKSDADATDVAA